MLLAVALAIVQAASPPPVAGDAALRRTVADCRGKLILLLVADRGEWKIQSLMFSYDGE